MIEPALDIEGISILRRVNSLDYSPELTERIIRANTPIDILPPGFDRLRFISTAKVFRDQSFRMKKHPYPKGDGGVYLATLDSTVLALCSFYIHPLESALRIIQLQGSRAKDLSHEEAKLVSNLYWERAFLEVVERIAKSTGYEKVQVIPSHKIPAVATGRLNPKSMAIRYDVPALERNYHPNEEGWYEKRI